MHKKLQIIYEHSQPYGIRDSSGYLFFFRKVSKFPNQEERYRKEIQELYDLADYILEALKGRANNSVRPTCAICGDTGVAGPTWSHPEGEACECTRA